MSGIKISVVDKKTAQLLGNELAESAKAIAEKYGLTIVPTGGSYSSNNYRKTIEFAVVSENGVPKAQEENFKLYAQMMGLPESITLGTKFTVRNKTFQVVGVNIKKQKKPFLLKDENGAEYSCSADYIEAYVALEKKNGPKA